MEAQTLITSSSESDTTAFAARCAKDAQNGDIFTLSGPLGAGKSVFCRSFIQNLSDSETDVPSPTFTLVQTYETPKGTIWHFDLYRIEDAEEIYEIGWEEALSEGILLIEWPERLENHMPDTRKEIIFENISGESRNIRLIHHGGGTS